MMRRPVQSRIRLALAGCLAATAFAASAQNGVRENGETPEALARRAAAAERACRTNEAISLYERLIGRDASREPLAVARLAELHAGRGDAREALAWAARAAARHPAPQAYQAGVLTRLGQLSEADLLLREALARETEPRRRVPLLWQQAEVQERLGQTAAALSTLRAARGLVEDPATRGVTDRRLAELERRAAAPEKSP
ncbi:MAG: hypothetical protein RBT78_01280 [Kiritimatiellia bacterium]|jgi:tetratricopeptide (TPR) repeat protein|nr:hypothetical protein [Kiritimatiellia bacterium]